MSKSEHKRLTVLMNADEKMKKAMWTGWCNALEAVRASLAEYPNAGGDIYIMKEVDRIVEEAVRRGAPPVKI